MIDTVNQYQLSDKERHDALLRALHSQPYFYKMAFPVPAGAAQVNEFSQRLGINRDFYLTEIQANFGEVFNETGSLFNASFWTAYNESLYRFQAGLPIPTGYLATEARFRTVLPNEKFDDRQFETFPKLIKQNGKIFGQFTDDGAVKAQASEAITVFKGFALTQNYLGALETREVNNSLAKDVQWEYFKITVTDNAEDRNKKSYILENDKYPRLIMGFGAINNPTDKAQISAIDVNIIDLTKRIQLTDAPIPLQFIAPRLTCLSDAHLYYLPVEYYFAPLAKLQFDINNVWVNSQTPAGAEIAVLMRTI